ncbi:MAG: AAA family ATPase [Bacteroidota bacterium]
MAKSKSLPALPFAVQGFRIAHFGGINETEIHGLPNSAKWIFLTGENGFGKTTVLQALAANLYGDTSKWLSSIPQDFNIEIEMLANAAKANRQFSKSDFFFFRLKHSEILPICGYGSSRLNISPFDEDKDLKNPIAGLFDTRTLLCNIELQLSRWYFKKSDPEFKAKFDGVFKVLKKLLPISQIRVDEKTDKVTYVEKDPEGKSYEAVEFSQLASGFKSIIALVGDLILRLFEMQPDIHDPAELEGIVLIDELDLHFHPNLQRELPAMLSDVFPKIQFIASTHSPIPILGAPEGSVFLTVRRSREEGITVHRINLDVSDLTPNLILTSPIFGFDNIFAETYQPNQRIRTEDTFAEKNLTDQVLERLKSFASEDPAIYEQVFQEKPSAAR